MKFCLFTDGACQPNPGKGGWAFIAYPEKHKERKTVKAGYEEKSTNNRMEITAVLEGLKFLIEISKWVDISEVKADHSIVLYSDSKYIIGAIDSWMHNWSKNGWKRKDKKPVLNVDLWKEIYSLCQKIDVECIHVKGHSGHPENEECDQLAVKQIAANK